MGYAQVPVDSLFQHDLTLFQRLALKPLSSWQHFTYGHPGYNCQFEPSCSHFAALAIEEHGVLAGMVVGTDRILRCNPSARHNHMDSPDPSLHVDGRLLEPVDFMAAESPARSPALAATLSIVPGLGRVYAGRPLDGLLSFLLIGSFAYATVQHYEAENTGWVILDGGLTILLWSADIYGAIWSAKHRSR